MEIRRAGATLNKCTNEVRCPPERTCARREFPGAESWPGPRAYLAGLPGLPGKALASDTR